jgi:hypothetical protein
MRGGAKGVAMIGKNLMKAFAFAGASAAVAAAMPAISEAHTHYTGKTPAVVSMMAETPVVTPVKSTVKKTSARHTTKKTHHKKKATVASKHKAHKKVVKK